MKKSELLEEYQELIKSGTKIEEIVLSIHIPTGETETICNPNVDAKIDYLKNARPTCESDLLFVGIKNNYQMISASQMHSVVSKYFALAGIDISKRKHGPHALRHSLASNLLMNNTPMHVIKDVLGHTNLNTTRMYLNIDFNTLLNFALEVPYESNN